MEKDFRLDIQGLRAIAILAVLIFHIDATKLPGGYIGVDLFFVISGFLITGHLMRDLNGGTFTFAKFYLKRIRRLYPALMAMIAATALGVYLIYLPQDSENFGKALMATSVYASNIFFYTQSDYFDTALHTNPLLHTWSLSVEEQFYIVFPLVLFLIYKFAKARVFFILAILGALSFVASEIVLRADPSAAFFMAPTRFGQFMAGALIALSPAPLFARLVREGMVWIGLALIGISIVFFSGKTLFPGLLSLVPTIGAALVIYAGQKQDLWATKLLSIKPALFFGTISYSLYLWHWPIILFYKYYFATEIYKQEKIIVAVLCVTAGYLSWRFIEKSGLTLDFQKPYFYKAAIAASLAGILLGGSFVWSEGHVNRFTPEQQMLSHFLSYEQGNLDESCFLTSGRTDIDGFKPDICMKFAEDKPNILLIGDSHGSHLYTALRDTYPEANVMQATSSGCRPLIGTKGEAYCTIFRDRLFNEFIPAHKYDAIIVSARWKKEEAKALGETIAAIKPYAKKIIVSGPIIQYTAPLPRLLALSLYQNDGGKRIDQSREFDKVKEIDKKMEEEVGKTDAFYFSPFKTFCPDKECITKTDKGEPVQFDYGHLTHDGAMILTRSLKAQELRGF